MPKTPGNLEDFFIFSIIIIAAVTLVIAGYGVVDALLAWEPIR